MITMISKTKNAWGYIGNYGYKNPDAEMLYLVVNIRIYFGYYN